MNSAFLFTILCVSGLMLCQGIAAAEPPPVGKRLPAEQFFEPINIKGFKLSPGGGKVCMLTRYDALHFELTLLDLSSMKSSPLDRKANMNVVNFWWKNDNLILFLVGTDDGVRDFRSINLATGKINSLSALSIFQELELINPLPLDAEQMLFRAERIGSTENDIIKVNVLTGNKTVIERDPGGTKKWFTNQLGETVAGWGYDPDTEVRFILWRANPSDKWHRRSNPAEELPAIVPLTVAADGRRLIVQDYRQCPKSRICYYNPINGETEEEIAPARETEPSGLVLWGNLGLPGAIVYGDKSSAILSEQMKERNDWIEKILPATERQFISFSDNNNQAIVYAYNDRNPGVFCLLNFETKKMKVLGLAHRSINPALMASSKTFSYTASDGLKVSGKITLPPSEKRPPLIVRIGPDVTSSSAEPGFDSIDQYFASRGYATVRINYRGTAGFGRDFDQAGDFQIKTGMVRDITEGVQWINGQDWIDSSRIVIFSENYGGMIAFPLAIDTSQFKALINFDSYMETGRLPLSIFAPSNRKKDRLLAEIGGRIAGEKYAQSCSPLKELHRLAIPSFHYYSPNGLGTLPPEEAKAKDVLEKHQRDFEFSVGMTTEMARRKNIIYWKAEAARFESAVAFLDKHLGRTENPQIPAKSQQ